MSIFTPLNPLSSEQEPHAEQVGDIVGDRTQHLSYAWLVARSSINVVLNSTATAAEVSTASEPSLVTPITQTTSSAASYDNIPAAPPARSEESQIENLRGLVADAYGEAA